MSRFSGAWTAPILGTILILYFKLKLGKHARKYCLSTFVYSKCCFVNVPILVYCVRTYYKPRSFYSDRNPKRHDLRARRTRRLQSIKIPKMGIARMRIHPALNVGRVLISRKRKHKYIGSISIFRGMLSVRKEHKHKHHCGGWPETVPQPMTEHSMDLGAPLTGV